MSIRYYDEITGSYRIKRRYVWAGWALFAGLIIGLVAGKLT
jgi:hypothetical protein